MPFLKIGVLAGPPVPATVLEAAEDWVSVLLMLLLTTRGSKAGNAVERRFKGAEILEKHAVITVNEACADVCEEPTELRSLVASMGCLALLIGGIHARI